MKKFILATMVALVSMSANASNESNNLIKGGVCPDTIPVAIHPIPVTDEETNEEAEKLNEVGGHWRGTATELAVFLGTDLKPNALSLKLNVNASVLLHEFRISVRNCRNHDGRWIELQRIGDDL